MRSRRPTSSFWASTGRPHPCVDNYRVVIRPPATLPRGAARERGRSEVRARALLWRRLVARRRRQAPATHLFELGLRGDLLREERRLDPVEQPLQPADELGLCDPQLGVGRLVGLERQRQPVELFGEFG